MRNALVLLLVAFTSQVHAEWAEKYPVGSRFPLIEANDQNNKLWNNDDLIGRNGLIFFVNRSTSW